MGILIFLSRASSVWLTLAVASCGGNALNIGSTDGGPDSDAQAGPAWNGTIDGVQLQDGSNQLTMTLSPATGGRATGTVLLGDGALLAPAKDPDTGYPPGAAFPRPEGPLGFFEGFRYPMTDRGSTGSSLKFRLAELDLWAQWCSLQTKTYPWPGAVGADGGMLYRCLPNATSSTGTAGCTFIDPTTGTAIAVDCGKLALCSADPPCDCSATGCSERTTSEQLYLDFDLVIAGSHADGTISGALGQHGVHFVRAP